MVRLPLPDLRQGDMWHTLDRLIVSWKSKATVSGKRWNRAIPARSDDYV